MQAAITYAHAGGVRARWALCDDIKVAHIFLFLREYRHGPDATEADVSLFDRLTPA